MICANRIGQDVAGGSTDDPDRPSPRWLVEVSRRGFADQPIRVPTVPAADLPADWTRRLGELGRSAGSLPPNNLYRLIANHPQLLSLWTEFAWALRNGCITPREVRELVILRTAQLLRSPYVWHPHVRHAEDAGVDSAKVNDLGHWRESARYSAAERAALSFAEDLLAGSVSDGTANELSNHFAPVERVELALTIAFYEMVARVADALGAAPDEGVAGRAPSGTSSQ